MNSTVGLVVMLEAKPGREEELHQLLVSGEALVREEPGTRAWFAFRAGPTTFGIFDTFGAEVARDAHLKGSLAQALLARAPELLSTEPSIRLVDILGEKAG